MAAHRVGQLAVEVADTAASHTFEVKMCAAILLGGHVLVGMDRTACAVGLFKAAERAARAQKGELTVDGALAHEGGALRIGLAPTTRDGMWLCGLWPERIRL